MEAGSADLAKIAVSQQLLDRLYDSSEPPVISTQALAELFNLLIRKLGVSRAEASERLSRIRALGRVMATDEVVLERAIRLAVEHRLQIFDSIILATASQAECELLLSEDLQHGFRWGGVEVRNPFAAQDPLY